MTIPNGLEGEHPVLRLALPVLHVTSAARAAAFYCGQLGFERRFLYRPDSARLDPCYMGLVHDQGWLHVSSFPGDGVPGAVTVLIVDDVDRWYENLQAKNVAVDLPPTNQSWGNREMYVRDPDGNRLRFAQPG